MVKLGDLFSIITSKGYAYLHYAYHDHSIGDMVRVLPGIYLEQPDNLETLVNKDEMFNVFFPLKPAIKKKKVTKLGNYSLNGFKVPNKMRIDHHVKGVFIGWHIVDIDSWQRELVTSLSDSQKKLSPWGVWNDTLLIERLEEGWSIDNWC